MCNSVDQMSVIPHSRPYIDNSDIRAVASAVANGFLSLGNIREDAEFQLAELTGRQHCRLCTSGTAALHIALACYIDGTDAEVIVPGYSCESLTDAVRMTGAIPVYADVNEDGNVTYETVLQCISCHTKAIIFQHTFHQAVADPRLSALTIPLIEDCTHCIYPVYDRSIAVASMGATKLITGAEAGAILYNGHYIHECIQSLLDNNSVDRPILTYRLSYIHAALVISQLKKIEKLLEIRRRIANIYINNIDSRSLYSSIEPSNTSIIYRYVIRMKNPKHKDILINYAHLYGVRCEQPIMPVCKAYLLPGVRSQVEQNVSIPFYPALSKCDIKKVITTINSGLHTMLK